MNISDIKVFLNHVYELQKGIRRMVLFTTNKKYEQFVLKRLENQGIFHVVQEIDGNKVNVFFGSKECIDVISLIVNKPLNELTPEEDFMLGAMLGYDICAQCKRFCNKKVGKSVNAAC